MTPDTMEKRGTLDLGLGDLVEWGRKFGASLSAPSLITFSGDLGSGKTTLIQAICRGCGVTEPVTSPTFAIVHWYEGARAPVFHLDLYRIGQPAELAGIGWDDVLDARAIVLVEWPERAGTAMPAAQAEIRLEHIAGAPEKRRLTW